MAAKKRKPFPGDEFGEPKNVFGAEKLGAVKLCGEGKKGGKRKPFQF